MKKKIRVKIVQAENRKEDKLTEKLEEALCFDSQAKFKLECRRSVEDYSNSQLDMLNNFHSTLNNLRSEIKKLMSIKAKLEQDIKANKDRCNPPTTKDLFAYCNHLNQTAKGKLGQNKKR
jgi:hypothetical protein